MRGVARACSAAFFSHRKTMTETALSGQSVALRRGRGQERLLPVDDVNRRMTVPAVRALRQLPGARG